MTNVDKARGFQQIDALAGQAQFQTYEVAVGNAVAIYNGDPLKLLAAGTVEAGAANDGVTIAAVAKTFKDSNGNSLKFLPALTAGTIGGIPVKGQVFEIQSDSGTNVAATAVNATANYAAGTGDTTTGFSGFELDASDIGTGQQCRIIGKVNAVGQENEWGEAHVNLLVVFVENAYEDSTSI